jgi:hypothetical protein
MVDGSVFQAWQQTPAQGSGHNWFTRKRVFEIFFILFDDGYGIGIRPVTDSIDPC